MSFHFPDAVSITEYIKQQAPFNTDFYNKNGVTEAIVGLAIERFANKELSEAQFLLTYSIAVYDLQLDWDGCIGQPIPIDKSSMGDKWNEVAIEFHKALLCCATFVQKK